MGFWVGALAKLGSSTGIVVSFGLCLPCFASRCFLFVLFMSLRPAESVSLFLHLSRVHSLLTFRFSPSPQFFRFLLYHSARVWWTSYSRAATTIQRWASGSKDFRLNTLLLLLLLLRVRGFQGLAIHAQFSSGRDENSKVGLRV